MHDAWQPVVQLADGMVLGAGSWLDALARDADLCYGFAHRPEAPFAQSWLTPGGQGVWTAWEGETRYDGAQTTLEFSAWVNLPDPVGDAYAKLQFFYGGAWHDAPNGTDVSPGGHWFRDDLDVAGVVSYDVSAYYTAGDLVHARLTVNGDGVTAVTSAWVYRAYLSGMIGFPTWPTWPTWTNATPHTAAHFNTLRSAADYLKACCERPLLAEAVADLSHSQNGAEETLARWSFRKAGPDRLRLEVTTTECDATRYVRVYLQDEQFPHGPTGSSRTTIASITSNTTTVISYDVSALTLGQRYCVEVAAFRETAQPEPHAVIQSVHIDDLGGETRSHIPGSFAFGDKPTVVQIDTLADDLQDMQPAPGMVSPLWAEHQFSTYRPFNRDADQPLSLFHATARKWGLRHTYPYLVYHGPAKLVSANGDYSYTLPDSKPTGSTMVFELKSLAWLAPGDWYAVEDTGNLQFAFEDWEA